MDLLRRFRMPVNLSIKNVPDHLGEEVQKRAAKHHRSLQGELISILEETVAQEKKDDPRWVSEGTSGQIKIRIQELI
jgi:plasmid stability protein